MYYFALSLRDFACVVLITLLLPCLHLILVEVFALHRFFAVGPLMLLDSFVGVCLGPDLRLFSLPCCASAAGSHCQVGRGIDKPPMRKGGHVDARALHLRD